MLNNKILAFLLIPIAVILSFITSKSFLEVQASNLIPNEITRAAGKGDDKTKQSLSPQHSIDRTTALVSETAVITEYAIPDPDFNIPTNIVIDSQGQIWFTTFSGNNLGELNPGDQTVVMHARPTDVGTMWGIDNDASGNIWYATTSGTNGAIVGKFNPSAIKFNEWSHAIFQEIWGLAAHPTTNEIWFTNRGGNPGINRLSPGTNRVTHWSTSPYTCTFDVDIDPAGNIWITVQPEGNQGIIRLDPGNNTMKDWVMPDPGSEPYRIQAISSDEIWFSEAADATNSLARFEPSTNTLDEFLLPERDSPPTGLIKINNRIWYAAEAANHLGRLSLITGIPTTVTVISPSTVSTITTTFTITPTIPFVFQNPTPTIISTSAISGTLSDSFTLFPLPTSNSAPFGIDATSPFDIWFTAYGYIGRLTTGIHSYIPLVSR